MVFRYLASIPDMLHAILVEAKVAGGYESMPYADKYEKLFRREAAYADPFYKEICNSQT